MFTTHCGQCIFWKQTSNTEGECTEMFPHSAFLGEKIFKPDDLFSVLVTSPDATCGFAEPKMVRSTHA